MDRRMTRAISDTERMGWNVAQSMVETVQKLTVLHRAVGKLLDSDDRHKIDPALRVEIEEAWGAVALLSDGTVD